jgi:hypothetical protein
MKSVIQYGIPITGFAALLILTGVNVGASTSSGQFLSDGSYHGAAVFAQGSQSQAPSEGAGGRDTGHGYRRPYTPRYTDPYRYRSPAYRRGYQQGYRDERGIDDPASRRDYRYGYGSRYRDENRYYGNRYRSYDGRYYGPRGPYGSPYRRYPGFGPYGSGER